MLLFCQLPSSFNSQISKNKEALRNESQGFVFIGSALFGKNNSSYSFSSSLLCCILSSVSGSESFDLNHSAASGSEITIWLFTDFISKFFIYKRIAKILLIIIFQICKMHILFNIIWKITSCKNPIYIFISKNKF